MEKVIFHRVGVNTLPFFFFARSPKVSEGGTCDLQENVPIVGRRSSPSLYLLGQSDLLVPVRDNLMILGMATSITHVLDY